MHDPIPEHISIRAYHLWEERGRPEGRADEFWLEAEAGLRLANATPDLPPQAVTLTNLDRALSPQERHQARAARHGANGGAVLVIPDHFMVVIDRAHLRVYRVRELENSAPSQFELAESFDLPAGKQGYTDRDTDQAGRFAGSGAKGRKGGGGSIDERLPMKEEHERRLATELAEHLNRFLLAHPDATWDYAAGPALHRAVLDRLSAPSRSRLGIALVKELIHQSPAQLRAHFIPAETAAASS